MVKSILVPLDPSPYTDKAIETAIRMAQVNKAHLTGMVVIDIPGIKKAAGPVPPGGFYYAEHLTEKRKAEAEERVNALLKKFSAACDKAGVKHSEARNQGNPSESILKESIYYDLLVMGLRTHFNFEVSHEAGDSLQEMLDESITPIYAVPADMQVPKGDKAEVNVCIPFDGSLPAARALQRFAQLIRHDLPRVKLVMSHEDIEYAEGVLEGAKGYLAHHGIHNVETDITVENIIDKIKNDYTDWADVFVVGAHSKKGLFDFMVGSLTKYLIEWNRKPVFIGQ